MVLEQPSKPRLRGVFHQYAFFVAVAAGAVLVALAPTGRARFAALVYAITLAAMLGASALYHRVDWSARWRPIMRRLDHSAIFLLIAGTYTPFCLLVLHREAATIVLAVVWSGAVLALGINVVWIAAPKWTLAVVGIALGWVGVFTFTQIPVTQMSLLLVGGLFYTAGALAYAFKRPRLRPQTFGYHELFHVLVIAAAASHFVAVAFSVLPD
ncbi:MAG: PAQR family membrane homeostasis protein TrhA [Gaiellaceae bacterium]